MRRYEFHSVLPPEEFLDDLQEWASTVGIICKIDQKRNRVRLWSKHTTFDRGVPFSILWGRIYSVKEGSRFQGYYRPAIPALIFNAVFIIWSIVLLGIKGAVFSLLMAFLLICIDRWDNMSERRRVVRMLKERYP